MTASPMRTAALLAIGDELLAGAHADLNSPAVARRLGMLGIRCERALVVGDDEDALAAAMAELCAAHPLVVATGGLGPTLDDVTRHAAARAAGVALELDPRALGEVRAWFERRATEMPAANERQALLPKGATRLPNRTGTAPGFRVRVGDAWLVSLPGPPPEAAAMLEAEVVPWLAAAGAGDRAPARASFYLAGLSESVFAEKAGEWMERGANPRMGVSARKGVLAVQLLAAGGDPDAALRLLEEFRGRFRERFGRWIFSEDDERLAFVVGRALIEDDLRIATAESCTGGLVASALTAVPGISAVFTHGWVTYSNGAKVAELGVDEALLERHGAVSEEVCAAMAAGARRRAGADLALAVTGVAGPSGGTPEKPVGTVWLGLADGSGARAELRRLPPVDRDLVRAYAVHAALDLLRRALAAPDPAEPR